MENSDQRGVVTGHVALGATQVAFGLFPVFGTLAFAEGGVSPLGLGVWRIGVGAVVLGGAALALYGRQALPQARDLPLVFVCALLGVAINQGLFLLGLSRSTPMSAGLVMCLIPVFTFGFAALAGQERVQLRRLLGLLLGLAAVGPLVLHDGLEGVFGAGLGNLMMTGNAAAYSLYLVLSKPLVMRYPPLAVTAWAYVGSLVVLPLFASGARLLPEPDNQVAWASLAYVLIFPTLVGYFLPMFALRRVRASTTAIYIYVQPLIAAAGAWLVFGERMSASMAAAAAALFVAIWLVSRR